MSEDKHADNDPERTLVTLEQLSQTIEVMTSVVNRLRQHLSEQLQAKVAEQKTDAGDAQVIDSEPAQPLATAAPTREDVVNAQQKPQNKKPESFVVEIRQHEPEPTGKTDKTLH